ncbi:MAG: hypothetical protein ACTSU4_01510 [Promethearchaeota archaeon]
MNKKSLLLSVILGIASWIWAFLIVGAAFFDYSTNQPIPNPNIQLYISLLIVNALVSLFVLLLYLWKYESKHPIIADSWAIDAIVLGSIVCGLNFLLDALFFGVFQNRNLISYFWLETTTGYFYPLMILETYILAYLLYGRKK